MISGASALAGMLCAIGRDYRMSDQTAVAGG
jgi:hypothetical protein